MAVSSPSRNHFVDLLVLSLSAVLITLAAWTSLQ